MSFSGANYESLARYSVFIVFSLKNREALTVHLQLMCIAVCILHHVCSSIAVSFVFKSRFFETFGSFIRLQQVILHYLFAFFAVNVT